MAVATLQIKIQKQMQHVIIMSLFVPSVAPMSTRGAHQKFLVPHSRLLVYQNSFVPAVVTLWNSLPANLTAISDPEPFRAKLGAVKLCV